MNCGAINACLSVFYRWLVLVLVIYILKLHSDLNFKKAVLNATAHTKITTYGWFLMHKDKFKKMGEAEEPRYAMETPYCRWNMSDLGPILAHKIKVPLKWLEMYIPDVGFGGFHAPSECRARHKVAILVPYRDRGENLGIFLYHMHPFLMRQMIQYRIFFIEQYGTGRFNRGALFNAGFLESQRFGDWNCFIFHDIDLLPLDDRILYTCPWRPTHMSASVEAYGFKLPYPHFFGGVTALTKSQFEAVNGYSNLYQDWGAEDDDMFIRLQSRRFPIVRYNSSIARYASMPHKRNTVNRYRYVALRHAKERFRTEGLRSVKYKMMGAGKVRLYSRIRIDVSPME